MEYTIFNCEEADGGMIALVHIVESMARHAATGYGRRKLHTQTLISTRERISSLVVDAASSGDLPVYSCEGHPIKTLPGKANNTSDFEFLLQLSTTKSSLTEWGCKRGDTFTFHDVQTEPIDFDLREYDGDGQVARVIEPGYYRGYAVSPCYLDQQSAAVVADALLSEKPEIKLAATLIHAPSGTPESAEPVEPVNEIPVIRRKRNALINELVSIWPSIDRDLSDASRKSSGLSSAAKLGGTFWDLTKAVCWAVERGKITKAKAAQSLATDPDSVFSATLRQLFKI